MKYLSFVPSDHRHYPEAQLTAGVIRMSSGEDNLALENFKNCLKKSSGMSNNDPKIARYYSMIKDNCQTNIGRLYYGQKKYDTAIKSFYEVDKKSYMWPYVLLEKGWAEYYKGNYNRSLGLISTYNAPLLDTYFQPEVELLKSLSYFKLCLWGDSLKVVDRYTENYKVRSEELKSILVSNINSEDYFFKLELPITKILPEIERLKTSPDNPNPESEVNINPPNQTHHAPLLGDLQPRFSEKHLQLVVNNKVVEFVASEAAIRGNKAVYHLSQPDGGSKAIGQLILPLSLIGSA